MEMAVLVMDSQNALEFLTRALMLCSRALANAAVLHQQETVKLVRPAITQAYVVACNLLPDLIPADFIVLDAIHAEP